MIGRRRTVTLSALAAVAVVCAACGGGAADTSSDDGASAAVAGSGSTTVPESESVVEQPDDGGESAGDPDDSGGGGESAGTDVEPGLADAETVALAGTDVEPWTETPTPTSVPIETDTAAAIEITPIGRGVSVTSEDQILVELEAADVVPANPFDLAGRTLVFAPDGRGGYSRAVGPSLGTLRTAASGPTGPSRSNWSTSSSTSRAGSGALSFSLGPGSSRSARRSRRSAPLRGLAPWK